MSVHFEGKCYKVKEISCEVPVETKRNKRQPKLVIQGFANSVEITDETAVIT